jgi:phage baseplate assembly protein W
MKRIAHINESIKGILSFIPSTPLGERVRVRGNAFAFPLPIITIS